MELIAEAMKEICEVRVRKIVNKRGQIRKQNTAGIAGKKVVDGHVHTINGTEKRNQRLGAIRRRRTLNSKSGALKRRSALFAAIGRRKRAAMNVTDTRHG